MHRRQLLRALSGAAIAAPFASSALLAAPGSAATTTSPPSARELQLQQLLDAEHTAGMPGAFAEIRDADHVFALATGVADITTGRAARPWFSQRIGGMSKSFVGALVLLLVGEGRINLDAPIATYLPAVLPDGRGAQITVRMLLNQTSGLAEYMNALFATPESIAETANRHFTPQELITIALAQPQPGPPGFGWSYAHTNYVILGLLVEKVTGRPYAEQLTRRVLRPLGLHRTYVPGHEQVIRGPHLAAYIPWSDGTLRDFSRFNMSWAWAGCDIVSTAHDINAFYRALLGGRLLDPGLLQEMKTTVPFNPIFADFAGYGLGIYWVLGPCGRTWGHNGLVVGQTVYSTHAEDGHSMQFTLAENFNFYEPISPTGAPGTHPIDIARTHLQSTAIAVCVPPAAAAPANRAGLAAAGAGEGWTPQIRDVVLPPLR